ncbi:hypothetical protein F2Q69_00020701 [Brassica cretica]|uniref:Uncharacterized protein n=1 Tax=Brassica cretica TaxID=69181 RepID=A0A8S9Q9M7_BRACR|nr:hypothetical protein F2Q69_00020701 [Brassica cretica]
MDVVDTEWWMVMEVAVVAMNKAVVVTNKVQNKVQNKAVDTVVKVVVVMKVLVVMAKNKEVVAMNEA